MNDKLKAAEAMAWKLNFFLHSATHTDLYAELSAALAAYEAAPAEEQPALSKPPGHYPDGIYGEVQPAEADNLCKTCGIGFYLPSGVCDHCDTPAERHTSQQLAAAQARIAELERVLKNSEKVTLDAIAKRNQAEADRNKAWDARDKAIADTKPTEKLVYEAGYYRQMYNDADSRVAVLEKALEGARDAVSARELIAYAKGKGPGWYWESTLDEINQLLAFMEHERAAQPSRERKGDK